MATEAATGSLLHFILTSLDVEMTWADLRLAITQEYINPDFPRRQRDTLAALQQRTTESVTSYNYEFAMLADEAYPFGVQDHEGLVRDYLSGLADRAMAARVLKKNPQTLEEAMIWAKEEVQVAEKLRPKGMASRVATIATGDPFEPIMGTLQKQQTQLEKMIAALQLPSAMHSQASDPAQKTGQQKHVECQIAALVESLQPASSASVRASSSETVMQLAPVAVQAAAPAPVEYQPPLPVKGYQQRGSMICYRCGKQGHMRRDCRVPQAHLTCNRDAEGRARPDLYCLRCRKGGHYARDCRAPPPQRHCHCGDRHWQFDCPRDERNRNAPPTELPEPPPTNQGN